jgi:uncharacterized protein (TIGR02145 family)
MFDYIKTPLFLKKMRFYRVNISFPGLLISVFCVSLLLSGGCQKDSEQKKEPDPTPPVKGIKDIDGNVYDTIVIGKQVWMKQNLKVQRYRNGDSIATTISPSFNIQGEEVPEYQWAYEGNNQLANIYGRLYTWFAATDTRKICPEGWHIPTNTEWNSLFAYLGGIDVAGGKMKDTGIVYWISTDTSVSNQSGFTALPGGCRGDDNLFNGLRYGAIWWSSTAANDHDALAICLYNYANYAGKGGFYMKSAFSVRCLKDQ